MNVQDLLVVGHYALLLTVIYRGITGPRHYQTHVALIGLALLTPFVSFRFGALDSLPTEAWLISAAFVAAQVANTTFHHLRPDAVHARGPEPYVQIALGLWCVSVRHGLDPSVWYRGHLGLFNFCVMLIFVPVAVLMTIYIGELTSHATDEIDFKAYVPSSRSNAAFLASVPSATFMTLYVTFDKAWLLAAGAVAFAVVRMLVPIGEEAVPRASAAR